MNREKKCLGHDRVIFMRACSEKKLSENTELMLSAIIKNARIKSGELAADEKALELTELIKDKT